MTDEPIYDDLRAAVQAGERLASHARAYVTSHLHHHDSAAIPAAATPERQEEMATIMEHIQSVEQHLEAFIASGKEKLEQDLPAISDFVSKASPIAEAFGAAVHLPGVPTAVQFIADEITKLDAALGEAKAQGASEQAAATQAAADAAAAAAPPAQEAPAA